MRNKGEEFARDLEEAGLTVKRKEGGGNTGFVVYGPTGQMLGAFGANVEKGRTKKNVLAQIKRATGIVVGG